jgi:HK97 family phage portal protein
VNVVRHTRGFGSKVRGFLRGRAPSTDQTDDSEVFRLKPAGRNLPEKRSIEASTGNLKTGRWADIIGLPASSGARVNEQTALGVAAVTACVSLLADMVAKLPLYLYQETKAGPKEIEGHPSQYLIGKNPGELHTAFELRQLMETGKGLGGNGYARVWRDSTFTPREIQWLAPCDVHPELIQRSTGERMPMYRVAGTREKLTRYDVLHVRGFSRDGICGVSPIVMLRESIGTALAQTTAAGSLIRNGAKFGGFLHSDAVLNQDQLNDAREEFNAKYTGALNAGRIPVLNGTFKFTAVNGMSMVDAQFLESRRFELQEIARIYRIPAFLIGDTTSSTTWGSGIEQQTLGFLNFCLDPHLVGWEQALGVTLLSTEELRNGYFFKFDRDELANVALEARANFYQTMRNIGVYSVNDVRAKLNEPLLEGGDDYTQPFNANSAAKAEQESEEPEPVE